MRNYQEAGTFYHRLKLDLIMRKILLPALFSFITFPLLAQLVYQINQEIPVINSDNDTLRMAWAGGLNAPQFNTMDMDGDGDEDLIIFERASNSFRTFENIGQQYRYNPSFEYFLPDDLDSWVIMKDYNCDGKKDIFTNTIFGIRVLKNVGSNNPAWDEIADPIYTLGSSGDINLQVNGTDIPGIADIDNDGDLDILVYNFSTGGHIRFHKNLSIETQGNCDTLRFQRVEWEWGAFEECECDYFAFEGKTCEEVENGRLLHAGGKSMLLIDVDADNDKDFIMSQEDCNKLYFLENNGDSESALMNDFSMQFPQQNPAHFNLFPAAFYEDVTFDGIPDLLVAPNLSTATNNDVNFVESSWLYRNQGSADNVDFQFVTNQFLQSEMIDAGENAQTAFIDLDGDSDLDLLIAGNYSLQDGFYYGAIKQYKNTGNRLSPSYQLVDNDYLKFSERQLRDLQISIANLDDNPLPEIIIHGSVPFSFSTRAFRIYDQSKIEAFDVPTRPGDNALFYDVDGDGNIDLLAGKVTGNLEYYKNNDSNENPVFNLEDNLFANIEENFLKREIYPAVADVDNSGIADLVTIDNSDTIFIYQDIFNAGLMAKDVKKIKLKLQPDETTVLPRLGTGNSISVSNIFAQKLPALAIGTQSGGVVILKNTDETLADGEKIRLDIYPNPAMDKSVVNIRTSSSGLLDVISMMGKYVMKDVPIVANEILQLDSRLFADGVYIIRIRSGNSTTSKRMLVWKQ